MPRVKTLRRRRVSVAAVSVTNPRDSHMNHASSYTKHPISNTTHLFQIRHTGCIRNSPGGARTHSRRARTPGHIRFPEVHGARITRAQICSPGANTVLPGRKYAPPRRQHAPARASSPGWHTKNWFAYESLG